MAMSSLRTFCRDKLTALEANGRRRRLTDTARLPGMRIQRPQGVLVDFSSNDALGLSRDPRVIAAAQAAISEHGTAATASRLVTGNHPLFSRLEEKLAAQARAEAALVFGSGTLANMGVIPALVGPGDLIIVDERCHSSLMQGIALAKATVSVVAHNDLAAFEQALANRAAHPRCLVVTESVFSMDGDRAPLTALGEACRAADAWLLVDDAHGFLVTPDHPTTCDDADIVTGSLSKAAASYGGTVCGPRELIDLLASRARTLVFSTGLPPASLAAALATLAIVAAHPELSRRPQHLAARFCRATGLPAPASHIVPLIVGGEKPALALMNALAKEGFCAVAIRPPTVPAGTSRVRLSFSAGHDEASVDALVAAVQRRWQR